MAKKPRQIERILGIDFETSNRHRASACSLGLALFDCASGNMLEKKHFLIKPDGEFEHFNMLIHGITPHMVQDAPKFPSILTEITSRLTPNTLIVAHNASFDISVLRRSCELYGVPTPNMEFFCTLVLARSLLPRMASYSLDAVSSVCQVPDFRHHHADDDAEACARIFLYFLRMCNTTAYWHLSRRSGIAMGCLIDGRYFHCHKTSEPKIDLLIKDSEPDPSLSPTSYDAPPDENSPFAGKTVVFTGALSGTTRNEAESIILSKGGIIGKGVTRSTNFIVCGYQDPAVLKGREKSSKLLKAEQLAASGQDIQILREDEFFQML